MHILERRSPTRDSLGARRRSAALVAVLCNALAACQPASAPAEPATAAGAVDTHAAALLQLAIPGGSASQPVTWQVPSGDADGSLAHVVAETSLVVPLAQDQVVLLVGASPSDERGQGIASHGSAGHLGAYWFTRQSNRWIKTAEHASVTWTGFHGRVGEMKVAPLGGGRVAVSIESGSCWQGSCGRWLSMYEVHADKLTPLLADLPLQADNEGAHAACEAVVKHPTNQRLDVLADEVPSSGACFNITGRWHIAPSNTTVADLVIRFSGVESQPSDEAAAPTETRAPDPTALPASDAEGTSASQAAARRTLLVRSISQTLVYRYHEGQFVKVKGQNPVPEF